MLCCVVYKLRQWLIVLRNKSVCFVCLKATQAGWLAGWLVDGRAGAQTKRRTIKNEGNSQHDSEEQGEQKKGARTKGGLEHEWERDWLE